MFTLNQNQATAASWVPRGTAEIRESGNCVGVARRSWGIETLGDSALIAFRDALAHKQIHVTSILEVPRGALCYGLHGLYGQPVSQFGHAWLAKGAGLAFSTDYGGKGTWTVQPVNLPRWTGVSTVSWTNWTPYGMLPLVAVVPPKPPTSVPPAPPWRQGKKVYASKMHLGQQNSDSVWNVSVAMHVKGYLSPTTPNFDDFGNTLRGAVGRFQQAQGWTGTQADGIPGPLTTARMGCVWVDA